MALIAVVAAGLGFAAYLAVDGLTTRPQPADVAIVFGNTVELTGVPSPRLAARLDVAKQLYTARLVGAIIVSGGTGKEGFDESAVMKAYLIERGIPELAVHADAAGVNTRETCVNARAFMRARGLRRANVVTQFFHVPRAKLECRRVGIEVVGGLAPRFFEGRDVYSLAREVVAVPVYFVHGRR